MSDTDLVLTGLGVVDFSARGLTEQLTPVNAGRNRRTVNGVLVDVSDTAFRKYTLSISGSDQEPPAFDGAWRGVQVTVDAVSQLAYPTAGSPGRTVVPGSSRVVGSFTVYRPRLVMLVEDFDVQRDEWGAVTSWTLDLEEV